MKWAILSVLLLSVSAFAQSASDQCVLVTEGQGQAAAELLKPGAEIATYCKPCADKEPIKGRVDRAGSRQALNPADIELGTVVHLNGKTISLATVFVKTGPSTYTNVSKMVGCPSINTPGFISVK